jgi:hypothetical protein
MTPNNENLSVVLDVLTKRTAGRLIGALFLMTILNGCYFPI